jgi:hypothetical protein
MIKYQFTHDCFGSVFRFLISPAPDALARLFDHACQIGVRKVEYVLQSKNESAKDNLQKLPTPLKLIAVE